MSTNITPATSACEERDVTSESLTVEKNEGGGLPLIHDESSKSAEEVARPSDGECAPGHAHTHSHDESHTPQERADPGVSSGVAGNEEEGEENREIDATIATDDGQDSLCYCCVERSVNDDPMSVPLPLRIFVLNRQAIDRIRSGSDSNDTGVQVELPPLTVLRLPRNSKGLPVIPASVVRDATLPSVPSSFVDEFLAAPIAQVLVPGIQIKGQDGRGIGVLREVMLLLLLSYLPVDPALVSRNAAFDLSNGSLLVTHDGGRSYHLRNDIPASHLPRVRFLGRLLAMALAHGVRVPYCLSRPLMKRLLDQKVSPGDMKQYDVDLHRRMFVYIAECSEAELEGLDLVWTNLDVADNCPAQQGSEASTEVGPLVTKGESVLVTPANRAQYLVRLAEHRTCGAGTLASSVAALRSGFHDVYAVESLRWSPVDRATLVDTAEFERATLVDTAEFERAVSVADAEDDENNVETAPAARTYSDMYTVDRELAERVAELHAGGSGSIAKGDRHILKVDELEKLLSGSGEEAEGDIDVEDWRAYTTYENGYFDPPVVAAPSRPRLPISRGAAVIHHFWNMVAAMTAEERFRLWAFVTGSSAPPLLGFGNCKYDRVGTGCEVFTVVRVGSWNDEYLDNPGAAPLPSASTCTNRLFLPPYRNEQVMRGKFLVAIRECSFSFGRV